MADELPTGDKAVFAFLEMFALAFAFEGVSRLLDGRYLLGFLALGISIVFFLAGIKWPQIKLRTGKRFVVGLDRIANDSRYRTSAILLIAFYIAISGLFYMHSLRSDLNKYVMPRSFTDKQSEELREYLSHHESHAVTVKGNPLDTEALEYASQIFNALKQTAWDVTFSTFNGEPFTLNNGLSIHVQGSIIGPPDPKHDPQQLLQDALRAAHIEAGGGGSGAGDYRLFILVRHRPLVMEEEETTLSKLGRWIMRQGQ